MSNDKKAIEIYLKSLKEEKEVVNVDLKTYDGSGDKYTLKLQDHKGSVFKKVKREAFIVLFERHLLILEKGLGKVIYSTHFLNLKEFAISDDPNNNIIRITFYGKGVHSDTNNGTTNPSVSPDEYVTLFFHVLDSTDKQIILGTIYKFYANTFPGCQSFYERRFSQVPLPMIDIEKEALAEAAKSQAPPPAGGYYNAYRAMCEWAGEPMCRELVWDLSYMYTSEKSRDFNTHFMNVQKIPARTLMPVFSVLGLNSFFTTLHIANAPIDRDTSNSLGWMFRNNRTLTDVSFVNCGLNDQTLASIADAINTNTRGLPLTALEISSNPLEDRGLGRVASILRDAEFRLTKLRLVKCGCSSGGITALISALSKNPGLLGSLKLFDFSRNSLGNETIAKDLSEVLSRSKIEKLVLRDTKLNFDAFAKYKMDIPSIDFSGNHNLTVAKHLNGLAELLNKSSLITTLSIANCSLSSSNIEYLWKSTTRMNKLEELNISDNESLGVEGVTMLLRKVAGCKTLVKLDFSNCFDKDQKRVKDLVDELKRYSASMDCPTHIRMAGGKHPLGPDLLRFVLDLIGNERIKYIDISGHNLGDDAALMISRILQLNKTMKGIDFDRNGITLKGLEEIDKHLTSGITLTEFTLPIIDISRQIALLAKSTDIERLKDVTVRIGEKLRVFTIQGSEKAQIHLPPRALVPGDKGGKGIKEDSASKLPVSLINAGSSTPAASSPLKSTLKDTAIQPPGRIQSIDYLVNKYPEIDSVAPADDDILLETGLFSQLSGGLLYSEDI